MIAVITLSLAVLFIVLAAMDLRRHQSVFETVESRLTLDRLESVYAMVSRVREQELRGFIGLVSSCHTGYTVSDAPFGEGVETTSTGQTRLRLARALSIDADTLALRLVKVDRDHFSYAKCPAGDIDLPMEALVISRLLPSGMWINAEIHPHEWHLRENLSALLRTGGAFLFVGVVAILFMRRLSRPLKTLTRAAMQFGEGLRVATLDEQGPPDVRRAIGAFNTMQQQVTEEIGRRTRTLAAISHDVRTPLTALRLKAELIDDAGVRQDIVSSIDKMELITASALEFLRGQRRNEELRRVDLSALLESECRDFEEAGADVRFVGEHGVHATCRPDALARAVRNLIDNAIKYAGSARVSLHTTPGFFDISVTDEGPGIPEEQRKVVVQPFERLSAARESERGGFGLGLAVTKDIAEGHDGKLHLATNTPKGLIATIRLPRQG
jgi:signal transduction histidine kinase